MTFHVVLRASSCCAAVVGLIVLGGCSSSGSGTGGASTPAAPASTPAAVTSSSGTPSAPPTILHPADKATTAAVKHAYTTFFNYHTSKTTAQSLLQDGAAFTTEIAANSKTARVQKPTVTVQSVKLSSTHTAKVIFTLYIGGSPVLTKTPGFAVLEGDTWKVAGQTFCALIGLNGSHPAVCLDPTATALPA